MESTTKSVNKTKSSSSSKAKKDEQSQNEKTKKENKQKNTNVKKDQKSIDEKFSSDFLRQKLREYFNHLDFKSTLQKDAIKEIMRGSRDVYISMPTGSGKSLCYHLPGMLHENKITLVFSPLIALIKDQMDHLSKLKICAESLNSKMTMKERQRVINDLRSIKPNTKFLYITPEQAATEFFRGLLDDIVKYNKLALIAVDECHCVSEMGHDFRKDYLKLGQLRTRYPTVKWIALTATASKEVTADIFKQLLLKEPKSFKTPCFRKNLFYDIVYKSTIKDDYIHLKEFIEKCMKSKGEEKPNAAPCGIIYCRTRESVERVATGLCRQNVVAKAYHAGLNDKDRKQVQEDWTCGKFRVICATISFGMGVDKSSVRFVVHWDVPQNIAAYYQESGRAGRDGKLSYCRVYYCRQEVKSINFILNMNLQKAPENTKAQRSVKEFEKLVEHCESLRCRHLLFSQYFGDATPDCKKRQLCDVCKDVKKAEKKLDEFHRLSMNGFNSKMDYDFNDTSDLYEGGRNTMQENAASYYQDDDDDSGSTSASVREKKAAKETTNLIQKELERRRQKIETAKKLEAIQTRSFGIRVKSSIHTSKIPGLDVKKRESYLDFLVKILKENAEKATENPAQNLKACDFEDIAMGLEYKCFTNNRNMTMYTKAFTNERIRIGKCTSSKQLLPEIQNHSPKKRTAHGGSAEAMQLELDSFMKKHKIDNDRNVKQQTVNVNVDTNTHTNVGFQTARQINNKLKEPNRMKKDPLTQTSINSFFSAGGIKREPDESMSNENDHSTDHLETQPDAKRRKVDDSTQNEPIKIKSEPIDEPMEIEGTAMENEEQPNIKNEPKYPSDADTDEEADSDTEQETTNAGERHPNAQMESRTEQQTNTQIKTEYDSGGDTDNNPSDDEEDNESTTNVQNQTNVEQIRIKQEPGISPNVRQESPTVAQPQMNTDQPIRIKSEPGTSHDIPNDESMDFQQQHFKNEPQDDPIVSDQDTDEEKEVSNFNRHIEQQMQQKNTDWYQQPSTSYSNRPTFPTSHSPNLSTTVKPSEPFAPFEPFELFEPSDLGNNDILEASEDQQNIIEPESHHSTTADGEPLLKLNQFDKIDENLIMNYIVVNDDEDNIDWNGLGELMEQYSQDLEAQLEIERDQLIKMKNEGLDQSQLKEVLQKLQKLRKKEDMLVAQKAKEEQKQSEQEKEKKQDSFMQSLFGPGFDASDFEQRLKFYTKPTTSRGYSSNSNRTTPNHSTETEDAKQKVTYKDIIDKPKVQPDYERPANHHQVSLFLNDQIKLKQTENKLDTVPEKAIKIVRDDKTIIKQKVERYLKPYYDNGSINKRTFEQICKEITRNHYELNDFDSESIRKHVIEIVETVKEAVKHKKRKTKP